MNTRELSGRALAALAAGILSACGGDVEITPPTPAPEPARLVLEPVGTLAIERGSIQQVTLSLEGTAAAEAGTARTVRVAVSDAAVAEVFPGTCTLSSLSAQSKRCQLTVHGKSNGTTTLSAQGDGLATVQIAAAVGNGPNYGRLAIESAAGAYISGPTTITYSTAGKAPYAVPLTARIVGSSGLDAAENVVISFAAAGVNFAPAQCAITTLSPECSTVATLTTPAATPITVSASGASYSGYSSIAVDAAPGTVASNGTIAISSQSGNNVPNGMKAPLWVNWSGASANDTVTVTLTLTGSGISFYAYTPGDNKTPVLSTTQTCSLSYAVSGSAPNVLGCGFGLAGSATSGNVTVNATATSASGLTYNVGSLVLGAVAPAPAVRTVTFTNNSSETIYVGITGGASAAYTSASPPKSAAATTANLKPGAASLCGPSNPQAACPLGTTCMQGGASPNANIAKTPFYCYYDGLVPSPGYAIAPMGGTTTISVSGSSHGHNQVLWSGNFYPRSGCDPTTGKCDNATCVGAAGGLACGPGTGPSPGINTLAEVTFQGGGNPDFYDVSIINGANYATEFGPTNVAISSGNSYQCGTAGSKTLQNGGYSAGGVGLPAATWTMSPSVQSFPAGAVLNGDASTYYRIVIPTSGSPTQCTQSPGTCTTGDDTVCGYAMSDLTSGSFDFATRKCGRPIAWATGNSIWGANQSATNLAPFAFNTSWPNGKSGTAAGTVSVGDLQLCINQTYSPYIANGTDISPTQPTVLACGGVMWGATQSPLPIGSPMGNAGLGLTTPSKPIVTANANWLEYVLPTIHWLKQACPTCYTYPFDDMSSTFTCTNTTAAAAINYGVTFSDLK